MAMIEDHAADRDGGGSRRSETGERAAPTQSARPRAEEETETAAPISTASPLSAEQVPRQIGRYTITRVIASGGMGTVYEAVQDKPRRTVAVKVIKKGIASSSALRRFEYEAQLLGRLRHPNIAQVFEAGTHDDGSGSVPYFAMEFIPDAKLLTHYAAGNRLGTRERLELFAPICDAVHHGHQKGVIHRDLKPSNVLVDAEGLPKIIDFGVARSTDSDVALTTIQTDVGQLIGTLQYMSPEQCAGDPSDIDTRSDVYALGVVLYELLSDARPYEVAGMPVYDAVRVIREEQPTKLSTVNRTLRGDVETICLKALEKDRERRYQSAAELADDVRHYLAGAAIIARPPSVAYQLRVFARRNKALFGAMAAVFVILLGATVVSTSQYFKAEAARREAEVARDQAAEERDEANRQRNIAEAQMVRAGQVATFMKDMLQGVQPAVALGRDTTMLREILDQTAERIGTELQDQPDVEAEIRDTIGMTYYDLGLFDRAESMLMPALQLRRAHFGGEHPEVADTISNLSVVRRDAGRLDEAEKLSRQALEIRRRHFGDQHLDVAESLDNLAVVLRDKGDYDEAIRLQREALSIRRKLLPEPDHEVAVSLVALGELLQVKGDYDGAERLYREALAAHRQLLGDDHPDVAMDQHYLATLFHYKGDFEKAEQYYRKALATYRRVLPEAHPDLAAVLNTLAALLQDTGDYDEAESFAREALAMNRKLLGEEHERVASDLNTLAAVLREKGDYAEAERMHRQSLDMRRKLHGDDNAYVGVTLFSLGITLTRMGRYEEAEAALLEGYRILKGVWGADHSRTREIVERLVALYEAWGKEEQAAQYRATLSEDP